MGASRASECEPGDLVDCLVRWHVASSRERRTQKNELRDIRVVGLQLHWIRLIPGRVAARDANALLPMTIVPVYLLFTPAALVPNVIYLELCISAADRATRPPRHRGEPKTAEEHSQGRRFDTADRPSSRLGTSVEMAGGSLA